MTLSDVVGLVLVVTAALALLAGLLSLISFEEGSVAEEQYEAELALEPEPGQAVYLGRR